MGLDWGYIGVMLNEVAVYYHGYCCIAMTSTLDTLRVVSHMFTAAAIVVIAFLISLLLLMFCLRSLLFMEDILPRNDSNYGP